MLSGQGNPAKIPQSKRRGLFEMQNAIVTRPLPKTTRAGERIIASCTFGGTGFSRVIAAKKVGRTIEDQHREAAKELAALHHIEGELVPAALGATEIAWVPMPVNKAAAGATDERRV